MTATAAATTQIAVLVVALAVCHRPLGDYIAHTVMSLRHLAAEKAI